MKLNFEQGRPYPHFKYPNEILISVEKMSKTDCAWFGVDTDSYLFFCENYGWMPTGVIMGVVNGKFTDTNKIGAQIRGNLGSASIAIVKHKEAIKMLLDAGYNVKMK